MRLVMPKTYQEYYSNVANDPHAGNEATIYNAHRVPTGDPPQPTHTEILEAVEEGPNPDCYMVNFHGRIRLVLRIRKVHSTPFHYASRYINMTIGQLGDITDTGPMLVEVPGDAFELANNSSTFTVPTVEEIIKLVASAKKDTDLFDAADASQPDTIEAIEVRMCQFLPYRYAALIIRETNFTPIKAWRFLYPQIKAEGAEDDHKAVINFLRASLVRQGPDQEAYTNQDPYTVIEPDPPLYFQRQALIAGDLQVSGVHLDATTLSGVTAEAIMANKISDVREKSGEEPNSFWAVCCCVRYEERVDSKRNEKEFVAQRTETITKSWCCLFSSRTRYTVSIDTRTGA